MKSPGKSSQNFSVFHTFSPCFLCRMSTQTRCSPVLPRKSLPCAPREAGGPSSRHCGRSQLRGRARLSQTNMRGAGICRRELSPTSAQMQEPAVGHSHGCLCRARQEKVLPLTQVLRPLRIWGAVDPKIYARRYSLRARAQLHFRAMQ